jgi:23S rRNA (guanosine2251-2'-O)-methyltransferase
LEYRHDKHNRVSFAMREWVSGRNPVYETLRAGRRHAFQLLVAEQSREKGRLDEIIQLCKDKKTPVKRVPRGILDDYGTGHQGVALEVSGYPYAGLQDMLDLASHRKESPLFLILDALQDPQNLGTLLRTAEGVGVHGVLLPLRHTASVTPAVVNASSGASEHLLVMQANLAQAIKELKEAGAWIVGLERSPDAQHPDELSLDGPIGLVVGSEGKGMRTLVRASCDFLMDLPMRGRVDSLNAAVAGSVALYLIWQRRGFGG